jgi:hypothetical protein
MPDRRGDAFQRALEEADRKDRALNGSGPAPTGRPRVRGLAFSATPSSAGKARFGLALDWTDEPPDPPAPPPQTPPREPAGRPVDTSAEIATELGFDAALTLGELARRGAILSGAIIPTASPWTLASAPTHAWRSPTRFTIERGGGSRSRDSRHTDGQINALKRQ